jgi:hypothetical protein
MSFTAHCSVLMPLSPTPYITQSTLPEVGGTWICNPFLKAPQP